MDHLPRSLGHHGGLALGDPQCSLRPHSLAPTHHTPHNVGLYVVRNNYNNNCGSSSEGTETFLPLAHIFLFSFQLFREIIPLAMPLGF